MLSLLPLYGLLAISCAPKAPPPDAASGPPASTPEAAAPAVVPALPFGHPVTFAPSELTASAEEITALAMAMMRGEQRELPFPMAEGEGPQTRLARDVIGPEHLTLTGFQWQLFVAPEGEGRQTLRLDLVLTADGLFLREASLMGDKPVSPGPALPGLEAAVERLTASIAAGDAQALAMNYAQCEAFMGRVCLSKGLYGDLTPVDHPAAFAGPHAAIQATRLGPVFKQDDGRLIFGMFMFTDGDEDGAAELKGPPALRVESRGAHALREAPRELPEADDPGAARKSSVYEDEALGSFEGPLCKLLAGEPLAREDLHLDDGALGWSKSTLYVLDAAIYVGAGYQPVSEDMVAMFLSPREADDPAAACLPITRATWHVLPLGEVQMANAQLIAEAMRRATAMKGPTAP